MASAFNPSSAMQALMLRAGPLAMQFEPDIVFLRRICLGDTELVRGIYGAVRDRNWGTVPARIGQLRLERGPDRFQLSFDVDCRQGNIDFRWHGKITGSTEGTVVFQFEGLAHTTFLRNRIGLCVLHPILGCAGQPCRIEHLDGQVETGVFPDRISPHQPFKEIRAIGCTTDSGTELDLRLEGETFEMEDQRNWTDASYKTYGTPLAIPFPVEIPAGSQIRQSVTVRLLKTDSPGKTGRPLRRNPADGVCVTIPEEPSAVLPPIGFGIASHGQPLSSHELEWLKRLEPAHLRCDLELFHPDWPDKLARAAHEAAALECGLHLALFVSDNALAELTAVAQRVKKLEAPISLWLLFHVAEKVTGEKWIALARPILQACGADIPLAAGTNAYFAELNRHRPIPNTTALPCFSINPQVHAFDDLTLMENLEAQADTVESARQFSPHHVVISPITLRPRFNPDATDDSGAVDALGLARLPLEVDPRQASPFCAAWTLGSLSRLAGRPAVHSLTYFETTGWRGVMETEGGSPWPETQAIPPGTVFPVYHVFAGLAGFRQHAPLQSSRPDKACGLALFGPKGERRILLGNLTGNRLPVTLHLPPKTSFPLERPMMKPIAEGDRTRAESARSRGHNLSGGSSLIEIVLMPYEVAVGNA